MNTAKAISPIVAARRVAARRRVEPLFMPPLIVGEMYVEAAGNVETSSLPPLFEAHQAIAVTDHIRELLLEAGYDCEALYI